MKMYVYAIRDVKTGFLAPTVEISDQVARRSFEHAVLSTEQSLFFSHPEDYSLWAIGSYETETGVLTPATPVGCIMQACDAFSRVKAGDDRA